LCAETHLGIILALLTFLTWQNADNLQQIVWSLGFDAIPGYFLGFGLLPDRIEFPRVRDHQRDMILRKVEDAWNSCFQTVADEAWVSILATANCDDSQIYFWTTFNRVRMILKCFVRFHTRNSKELMASKLAAFAGLSFFSFWLPRIAAAATVRFEENRPTRCFSTPPSIDQ